MVKLTLVRHGETEENVSGILGTYARDADRKRMAADSRIERHPGRAADAF